MGALPFPFSLLCKNASRIFKTCGTKVFCRFRAHPQASFPWYFQLQEQCLPERQFISLEEDTEWINANTREHFTFLINRQFKLMYADSQNATVMLSENIRFPYRNNKNFLSFKILFLLQPEPMQSNHRESFGRIMQKCLPQLMLHCSLQHLEAAFFSMSYAYYILCFIYFSKKGPLTQASFSETPLLHSWSLLPHHVKYNHFREERYITSVLTPFITN